MSKTAFRAIVALLMTVAVAAGILIGLWAGGVFDRPTTGNDCFWAEQLHYDSIACPDVNHR